MGPVVLAALAEMEAPVATPEETSDRGKGPKTSGREERSSKSHKRRETFQGKLTGKTTPEGGHLRYLA